MVITCTGNSVCCCWRRAILHKRGGELSPSVRCSSVKVERNRRSRPKKDNAGMFYGLFYIDQNSQTSVLITRFTSALADSIEREPRESGSLVVSLDVLK